MFFIKKLFNGQTDDTVHSQFVRFGKGIFENKAAYSATKSTQIKINGTFELANDFVRFAAANSKKMKISGIIMAREDLGLGENKEKKGLFHYEVDREISSDELLKLGERAYMMLLDCDADGINIKMKKKLPRPKAAIGNKPPKIDDKFCVMLLPLGLWGKAKDEFLFELPEGKKFKLSHSYSITEIILPKGEKDFEKMRLLAKKKGKIKRVALVDGNEIVQEKDFIA